MTMAEKLVITAYTKVLMVNLGDFYHFCDHLLGRKIYTHEYAIGEVWTEIKETTKDWFFKICEDQFTKEDEKTVMDILEGKKYE